MLERKRKKNDFLAVSLLPLLVFHSFLYGVLAAVLQRRKGGEGKLEETGRRDGALEGSISEDLDTVENSDGEICRGGGIADLKQRRRRERL
ncbi:hypothetical protein E2542_SST20155 [Spatholobus suberectus]|nr:hypothetical protein E2542_SST20155 [Spatholobus suberectus]